MKSRLLTKASGYVISEQYLSIQGICMRVQIQSHGTRIQDATWRKAKDAFLKDNLRFVPPIPEIGQSFTVSRRVNFPRMVELDQPKTIQKRM